MWFKAPICGDLLQCQGEINSRMVCKQLSLVSFVGSQYVACGVVFRCVCEASTARTVPPVSGLKGG